MATKLELANQAGAAARAAMNPDDLSRLVASRSPLLRIAEQPTKSQQRRARTAARDLLRRVATPAG